VTKIDWTRLSPHLPLDGDDPRYIPRPSRGGAQLAAFLKNGMGPIAVTGPVGCGKSTELAVAANSLRLEGITTVHERLDRVMDMHSVQPQNVYARLVRALALMGQTPGVPVVPGSILFPNVPAHEPPPEGWHDRLLRLLRHLRSQSPTGRMALLIDGFEKSPVHAILDTVSFVLSLSTECEMALVVPPSMVTGPDSYSITSQVRRVFPVSPMQVRQARGNDEGAFFFRLFASRISANEPDADPLITSDLQFIVGKAAEFSGGIPRTFLQLVQDAAGYASVNGRELPTREDLLDALKDHTASMKRLLREGDVDLLHRARGTDGLEIPIDARIRLLTHGLLLEHEDANRTVTLSVHPLLDPLIHGKYLF